VADGSEVAVDGLQFFVHNDSLAKEVRGICVLAADIDVCDHWLPFVARNCEEWKTTALQLLGDVRVDANSAAGAGLRTTPSRQAGPLSGTARHTFGSAAQRARRCEGQKNR